MDFSALIMQIDNILWATPLIILTFGLALIYCIAIKFGNVTNIKLQWKLLTKGESSEEGLSAFETFCSVAAYRVAVGNIGGVMVAIMYGGPGAVIWMIITALVTSAIAFAENSLGQLYKVRMDGQYRGGPILLHGAWHSIQTAWKNFCSPVCSVCINRRSVPCNWPVRK